MKSSVILQKTCRHCGKVKVKKKILMIRLKYAKSAFLYAFGVDRTLPVQNLVVVAQQVILL